MLGLALASPDLGPDDFVVIPAALEAKDDLDNPVVVAGTADWLAIGGSGNTGMDLSFFGNVAPFQVDLIDRNGGDDTLIGNATNNRIEGGPGADTLTGNGGADTFAFNQGDSPGVTFFDLDSNGMDEHDTFSFAGAAADVITDFQSGDRVDLNLPYFPEGTGGYMGLAPSSGQAADQSFFLVRGEYFNGDFTLDNSSGFDTLVVYDGNPNAGEVLQTGLVISGWVPDDLITYIGSGIILMPTL
jgi:Ca2+-binding RTX toxin-like protein